MLFVRALVRAPVPPVPLRQRTLVWATVALGVLTMATPLVDRAEVVSGGQHVTHFGPLFGLYVLFVAGCPSLATAQVLLAARTANGHLKSQLAVIGLGMLVSSAAALITNLLLPYAYHVYALQEAGAVAILAFVAAAGYAISVQHLFDVRLVIRKALVLTVLVAFVEQVYSESIALLVERVPASHSSALVGQLLSLATVLFIAASFHPLRRALERYFDRLLYGPAREKRTRS